METRSQRNEYDGSVGGGHDDDMSVPTTSRILV